MEDVKKKPFIAIDHGTDQIDLGDGPLFQMRPTEIHHKADGAIGDEPSFLIVMERPLSPRVIGQVSLKMLNEGLADIGYEVVRKSKP